MLTILVILASLSSLATRGGLQQQKLVKAAEQVRMAWSRARVEAIKTGRVQVFYHAPYKRHYFVMPQQSLDDPVQDLTQDRTGLGTTNRVGSQRNNNSAADNQLIDSSDIRERKLPEGIVFLGAEIQSDQRSTLNLSESPDPATSVDNLLSFGNDAEETPQDWGMPLFFFPDGSSSVARMILKNERGQAVVVYLRGMTGMVRVGKVQEESELAIEGMF